MGAEVQHTPPFTDERRDQLIVFALDAVDTMHERISLLERQMAETSLHWIRLEERGKTQDEKIDKVLDALRANTEATVETREASVETRDMLNAWRALKGTGTLLGWLGDGAKWLLGIGAFVAAAYAFIKGGPKP